MKFKSISATDKISGWNVENIQFNPMLTLLVGASGVGKTRILNYINGFCLIAKGFSYNGIKWKVEFEQDGRDYIWEGEFETKEDYNLFEFKEDKFALVWEQISDNEDIIVLRSKDSFKYQGKEIVKLDNTKSAVELLKEEASIKPIYNGFLQCDYWNRSNESLSFSPIVDKDKQTARSIKQIKELGQIDPLEKLFLLRENKLKEFDIICGKFQNIFPNVEKIDFISVKSLSNLLSPVLIIREKNVNAWIPQNAISSGMMRTLSQITTLVLANDGDVIMIDEFENGLGVNCINELADLIMEPEADIQVVMTSHHPYIINTIPVKDWKILTRNGSDVQVHTAAELHIGEHSKHEAFMQLLQTPEYKTGQNR
jgi:predicted ATPase